MVFRQTRSILAIAVVAFISQACAESPIAETASTVTTQEQSGLPGNWREIKEGVDGYPAGPMLEIALRRTHGNKLEMFKWRSEFISMLSAQPGPLVEREWRSIEGIPANYGAGTWTGMTWWENQQRWQDMANMLFPSPVTGNWLETIHMTLIFVKPVNDDFDLRTLAQSGDEVLEMGLLVFPTSGESDSSLNRQIAGNYLASLEVSGVATHSFDIYPNPSGFLGPYTAAYNQNGPPATAGEEWFVYMANYESLDSRDDVHGTKDVQQAFGDLRDALVNEHSDIQVMSRSTSKVCCKASNMCSIDPNDCDVGMLGSGDTWAGNCNECPRPCMTGYGVCSNLSPETCSDVGGSPIDMCPN